MNLKKLFIVEDEKTKEQLDNSIFKTPSKTSNPVPVNSSQKTLGVVAHLSSFIGYFIPFGHILAPFLMYYINKEGNEFVKENARAAVNFQLSFTMIILLAVFLYCFGILYLLDYVPKMVLGFIIGPIILFYLFEFYFISRAIQSTSDGKVHKYPFTIEFFKKI